MADNAYSNNAEELDSFFDMNEEKKKKMQDIKKRLTMPNPDVAGDTKTIRVLQYNNNGNISVYKKVSGEKFKTPAIYLNVEEVGAPGIQKDMNVSKTLYQSITRELTNRGLKFKDLPGKVLIISADYWMSAPKNKRSQACPKCAGQGCTFCTIAGGGPDAGVVTGMKPPVRYDAVISEISIGPATAPTKKIAQF